MALTYYLQPRHIVAPLKSTTKEDAIKELVLHLAKEHGLKSEKELLKLVTERESCASTFLPMGVAVPHARTDDVKDIVMALGTSQNGIVDTAEIPITAYVIILFFSPVKEKEFGRHLKLLARVAAMFSDPSFARELAGLSSAEEIFARLQHKESKLDER